MGDAGRPPRDKPQPRGHHRRRRPPQDGGGRAGRGLPTHLSALPQDPVAVAAAASAPELARASEGEEGRGGRTGREGGREKRREGGAAGPRPRPGG